MRVPEGVYCRKQDKDCPGPCQYGVEWFGCSDESGCQRPERMRSGGGGLSRPSRPVNHDIIERGAKEQSKREPLVRPQPDQSEPYHPRALSREREMGDAREDEEMQEPRDSWMPIPRSREVRAEEQVQLEIGLSPQVPDIITASFETPYGLEAVPQVPLREPTAGGHEQRFVVEAPVVDRAAPIDAGALLAPELTPASWHVHALGGLDVCPGGGILASPQDPLDRDFQSPVAISYQPTDDSLQRVEETSLGALLDPSSVQPIDPFSGG